MTPNAPAHAPIALAALIGACALPATSSAIDTSQPDLGVSIDVHLAEAPGGVRGEVTILSQHGARFEGELRWLVDDQLLALVPIGTSGVTQVSLPVGPAELPASACAELEGRIRFIGDTTAPIRRRACERWTPPRSLEPSVGLSPLSGPRPAPTRLLPRPPSLARR